MNYKIKIRFAKKLRKEMTKEEKILWYHLRSRRFLNYKFRRQVNVNKYIIDFLCFEKKLVIEVDGSQHAEKIEYDNLRTEYLNKRGYKVIRFWNNEILFELESVLTKIEDELWFYE